MHRRDFIKKVLGGIAGAKVHKPQQVPVQTIAQEAESIPLQFGTGAQFDLILRRLLDAEVEIDHGITLVAGEPLRTGDWVSIGPDGKAYRADLTGQLKGFARAVYPDREIDEESFNELRLFYEEKVPG
jgi:hypothetical protein